MFYLFHKETYSFLVNLLQLIQTKIEFFIYHLTYIFFMAEMALLNYY